MFRGIPRVVLARCLGSLCGCIPTGSEKQVIGRFELKSPDAKRYPDVRAGHFYSETIQYSAGTDRWNQRVCFGSLLLPKQVNVMDRFVENSEPAYRPKTVGAPYQLDECPSPLMEYGRTILRDRSG